MAAQPPALDAAQFQQLLAAVAPQPAAAAFALTPGQANPNQTIDYTSSSGIKVWNEAIAPLTFEFNIEAKEVNAFCESLMERVQKSGWKVTGANVIDVPETDDPGAPTRNVITEYGQLSVERIRAYCTTYIHQNTRQAQNNIQMYHCISSSLTKEGRIKILAEQDKYHIGEGDNRKPCGPLLFKLLMQKAIIDTRATASLLRENLSSLDTYMAKIQSNIEEFNKYVKVNWEGLKAHGECCDDLMINLFKGYQAASDREFVRYINQKKDAYDDGSNLTPEQLMTFALNKYEVLTKQDLWNAKTAEQEQIVALSAELGKIKDVNLKLARTLQSNGKGTNKCPNDQKGKGKNKGKGKGKGKGKESKWAWKKVAPKENESKTKKFNDYTYHWCETHKAWGMHLPEACELKKQLEAEQQKSQSNDNSNQSNRTSYANALQAIITDLHDEE